MDISFIFGLHSLRPIFIMEHQAHRSKIPWFFLILMAFLTLVLLVAAHFYFSRQMAVLKREQHKIFQTVLSFKIGEINEWFHERRAEGIFVSTSMPCVELIDRLTREPKNDPARNELTGLLMPIKRNHEYLGISVYDRYGNNLLQIGDLIRPDKAKGREDLIIASGGKEIEFSEMLTDPHSGNSFLNMKVPIFRNSMPVGLIIFQIDPTRNLFPIIKPWPFPGFSATILLAMVESDRLIFLFQPADTSNKNIDRHKGPNTDELSEAIPRTKPLNLIEAKDYRGIKVFAEIFAIPGTSWILISKIDQDEVFASLKKQALNLILYICAFLFVVVIIGVLVWKNQQLLHYRTNAELQSQSLIAEERVKFMNTLLHDINDAVITFDKDLMIMSWNTGAERIYGWKAEEVIGKYGGGSLRVDFPGPSREIVFKELEQKGSWKGEVVHKRKDGTTVYVLSTTSQLLDENGKSLGIITINKDISEVVHSEKVKNAVYRISELAHSTKDLDELYAAIHVVIGELMDARNFSIALFDAASGNISFPYFVDEKDSAPATHQRGSGLTEFVIHTGKPLLAKPEDLRYFIDRGIIDIVGTKSIDWLGIPLKIENETIGVVVVQSYSPKVRFGEREKDILIFVSEQIALSIHRKKIRQELIDAKQKAEVSNKLTSSLLANMNHELRTPMNGILGFAEILMNDLSEEETRSKAENILISGRRLMDTLDAIMDLSYLESDKVTRKFKTVSLDKILKSVLTSYEGPIRRKKLELIKNIRPGLFFLGDDHLFQHVMKNLVDNAVKYTETGSITVEADQVEKDGKTFVSIRVLDTGIGIAEENYSMIFDAFRQVSEGYGRQFEGSGLGLSISKKIINLMNGEIHLKSKLNEGSEFRVIVPAVIEPIAAGQTDAGELLKPKIHISGDKKLPDILLVEDNTVNLQLLMVYIRDHCNIYSALDGKSAVDLTRQQKFDAILMDINLGPGMDGIQAMLEIRKRPDYRITPIIAVTGYASIGDRERLLSVGFSEYLPKPFTREKIAGLIEEFFMQKQ